MSENILLIKHGALGDIIQGFDAFASLRKGFPTAHIAVLTTRPYEKLMLSSNWFDEVIIDQRASVWNLLQAMRIRTIFKQNWDKVIDLQCSERTATYAKLKFTSTRWFGTAPNATDLMTDFAGITNRQRMLAAVSMAGASKSEPDLSFLTSFGRLQSRTGLKPPYALILPSSSAAKPSKRWPIEYYIRLAEAIKSEGLQPVLSGTEIDRPITSKIADACPECLDLTGKPDLFFLAELATGASIIIGNDTGPVFLAARLNVPTVMLMGADTDPSMSAPYGEKAHWIKMDRLDRLSFEEVWKSVRVALKG